MMSLPTPSKPREGTPRLTMLLGGLCLAIAVTTVGALARGPRSTPLPHAYVFPEQVPLQNWKRVPAPVLTPSTIEPLSFEGMSSEVSLLEPLSLEPSSLESLSFEPSSLESSSDASSLDAPAAMEGEAPLTTSVPEPERATTVNRVMASTVYVYEQEGRWLAIEMHYLANSNGNLKPIVQRHRDSVLDTLRQRSPADNQSYSLYSSGDRTYLLACLNARGGSTVTDDDFRRNRYRYDLRPERIALWLTGRSTLHDRRCLLNRLSVATADFASPDRAEAVLEGTWQEWSAWWQSRFPAL